MIGSTVVVQTAEEIEEVIGEETVAMDAAVVHRVMTAVEEIVGEVIVATGMVAEEVAALVVEGVAVVDAASLALVWAR